MSKSTVRNGHLASGVTDRSNGRKIDTWTFYPGDIAGKRDSSNRIVFEVSLLKSMEFSVETKDIPSERWKTLKGSVLSDLHAQAKELACTEFDLKHGLVWSDWLEIKIAEASMYDRRDVVSIAQASLSYGVIPRAEAKDGSVYTVNGNGVLISFPEPTGVYRPAEGEYSSRRPSPEVIADHIASTSPDSIERKFGLLEKTDGRPTDSQFAYLPDTPENRAGLDSIIDAIESVNVRLQKFLEPDVIEDTLQRAALSGTRLLSGPQEPSTPKKRMSP